jgi:DNA-directed RNA polymerase subunit RPC12/RpoP
MDEIVEVPCACGRVVRRKDPKPGEWLHCYYCGHAVPYGTSEGDATGVTREASGELFATLRAQGALAPAPTHCASCSAALDVAREDLDAGLVRCAHCGTRVTLPGRGASHERVQEGDGTRTVERVSVWEGPGGSPGTDATTEMADLFRELVGDDLPGTSTREAKTTVEQVELDPKTGQPIVGAKRIRRG